MKKIILTAAISMFTAAAFCQAKPDTSKRIPFYQHEVGSINNNITQALQRIHKLHMDSMTRDTLDNLLAPITDFLRRRYLTTLADSNKTAKKH